MRYRKLDANGDYSFGGGLANFYINNSAAVAQLIETRLRLIEGEWFLDKTDGTPYLTEVLGFGTQSLYDRAIKDRIIQTDGVAPNNPIGSYSSSLDPVARKLTAIAASVQTIYSGQPVQIVVAT